MKDTAFTIIDLSKMAGDISKAMNEQAGLDPQSALVFGIASGFDVAITLLEQSTGVYFNGLLPNKALMVSHYFREEADCSEKVHKQIAIWCHAWAELLEQLYLK